MDEWVEITSTDDTRHRYLNLYTGQISYGVSRLREEEDIGFKGVKNENRNNIGQ